MRQLFLIFIISMVFLLLSGCKGHNPIIYENPLINDDVISYLKKQMETDSPENNLIAQCGSYYAGYLGTDNFRKPCDKWSVDEFEALHRDLNITYKANVADLRDRTLWQIVIPRENPVLS